LRVTCALNHRETTVPTDATLNDATGSAGEAAREPLERWLWRHLRSVVPEKLRNLLDKEPLRHALEVLSLGFMLALAMPVLSIGALWLSVKLLPAWAGKPLHDAVVETVYQGYAIDEVEKRVALKAAQHVIRQLKENNKSLDYVQNVEFILTKGDGTKAISAHLLVGQRANLTIRRSQVVPVSSGSGPADASCALPDLSGTDVLQVRMGNLVLADLPSMSEADGRGNVPLDEAWWKNSQGKLPLAASRGGGDEVANVEFVKTPAFQKLMTPCTALRVEATLEVFKRDVEAQS
jgi:hypothetical protein